MYPAVCRLTTVVVLIFAICETLYDSILTTCRFFTIFRVAVGVMYCTAQHMLDTLVGDILNCAKYVGHVSHGCIVQKPQYLMEVSVRGVLNCATHVDHVSQGCIVSYPLYMRGHASQRCTVTKVQNMYCARFRSCVYVRNMCIVLYRIVPYRMISCRVVHGVHYSSCGYLRPWPCGSPVPPPSHLHMLP